MEFNRTLTTDSGAADPEFGKQIAGSVKKTPDVTLSGVEGLKSAAGKPAVTTGIFGKRTQRICQKYNDVGTASLIEVWIDETERRTWCLSEIVTEP